MAASVYDGPYSWEMTRDDEWHREYRVAHRVKAATTDGPQVIMNASGLPSVGSIWNFDNDYDAWAFCTPEMKISPFQENPGEPHEHWLVEQKFSTQPLTRCGDTSPQNPLDEPTKISGSFIKEQKHRKWDLDGNLIANSAHEELFGPETEFNSGRPTVTIEMNTLYLDLDTFASMIDTVNISPMWGLDARCVLLSNVTWSRKIYGVCTYYYTRSFEFEVNYYTFDRQVQDGGTKALNGHWNDDSTSATYQQYILNSIDGSDPDPDNPNHFIQYKDMSGENAYTILNGSGLPAESKVQYVRGDSIAARDSGLPGVIEIKGYYESNFFELGIPSYF